MKKHTILYIDDDESSLFLLKVQLNDYDINLITETNGKLGYKRYMEFKDDIDLVLIDLRLPYMTGNDLLSKIRKNDKNIPIIILTASIRLEEKELSLKKGATNYYIKPIKKEDVSTIVNEYIKQYAL